MRFPLGVAACLLLLSLGACSSLPSSGPDARLILRAASGATPAFRIVNLNGRAPGEAALAEEPAPPPEPTFAEVARIPPAQASVDEIQVGDVLQVTIYEIGASLFGASSSGQTISLTGSQGAPAANAQTLPPLDVGPSGDIVVPYVGKIHAAGRSREEVRSAIEMGLRGKSQNPQVMLSVRDDVGNTVILIGEVRNPGRKPLGYQRERLLDMIAISGGANGGAQESLVRVTRRGKSAEMSLDRIDPGSDDDIGLQPHDRIEIIRHPRTFTAFGASGRVSQIPFQSTGITLAEALAMAGGPSEQQADPTGVFIFRQSEDRQKTPVLYRLNLKDPSGYFVAQMFRIKDKDLIYVANARANAWAKLLSMINSVATPVVTSKQLSQ